MQVLKIALKVLLVVPTCQPIHSSCGAVAELVGNEVGVVSGVINLEIIRR